MLEFGGCLRPKQIGQMPVALVAIRSNVDECTVKPAALPVTHGYVCNNCTLEVSLWS